MASADKIYRDVVLKVLTDNPGAVLYRDDIAEQVNKQPEQVAATIYSLRGDSTNPLSKDIEVVVPGRAWRYVPNTRVTRAVRVVQTPSSPPTVPSSTEDAERRSALTVRIREFFYANPGRIVYIQELYDALVPNGDIDMSQLRVGIANAKQNHPSFGHELSTAVAGRAWLYTPSTPQPNAQPAAPTTTATKTATTTTIPAAPEPSKPLTPPSSNSDNLMLLERIGNLVDGGMLVRDAEQTVYRLYPL